MKIRIQLRIRIEFKPNIRSHQTPTNTPSLTSPLPWYCLHHQLQPCLSTHSDAQENFKLTPLNRVSLDRDACHHLFIFNGKQPTIQSKPCNSKQPNVNVQLLYANHATASNIPFKICNFKIIKPLPLHAKSAHNPCRQVGWMNITNISPTSPTPSSIVISVQHPSLISVPISYPNRNHIQLQLQNFNIFTFQVHLLQVQIQQVQLYPIKLIRLVTRLPRSHHQMLLYVLVWVRLLVGITRFYY